MLKSLKSRSLQKTAFLRSVLKCKPLAYKALAGVSFEPHVQVRDWVKEKGLKFEKESRSSV